MDMPADFTSLPSGTIEKFADDKYKQYAITRYIRYFFARTQSIFSYSNLPKSIPQRNLELIIQSRGFAVIADIENNITAFSATLGGEPTLYLMPTLAIVANPRLKKSYELEIDNDCVVINNDSMYAGLFPLFNHYANLLVENDISMRMFDINSRLFSLIQAGDDRSFESAKKFIADVESGKMSAISSNLFLDGIKTQPYATAGSQSLTSLIEYQQYIKSSCLNDIGLNSNYNMKREAINSDESSLNDDVLLPFIDDMMSQRRIAIEKINSMFNLNISIEFNSSWKNQQEEQKNEKSDTDDETNDEELSNEGI